MLLTDCDLWRDARELPDSLTDSLALADGHAELARTISERHVQRVILSGNGASWYAANAAWLVALETALEQEVVTVPAGILAQGGYRWRDGDFLLGISSSGSLRDLLDAIEDPRLPRPFGLITADEQSPLGRTAGVRALMSVRRQRAITHSQAYLGSVVVVLDLVARLARDQRLHRAIHSLPDLLAAQLSEAPAWAAAGVEGWGSEPPRAAVSFGSGASWAAAQEAALLLKEVAGIPTEGVETREGATTGMYALDSDQLVLALPRDDDAMLAEAAAVCAGRGAQVLTAPWPVHTDRRVAPGAHFLHPLALAIALGLAQDLNPDQPSWYAAYVATARRTTESQEER